MGRMFRIITAGSPDSPNGGPATMALDDAEPFVGGGAPFIEVGGPNGPVHSLPKSAPKPAPEPEKPARPPAGEAYLSVALRPVARPTADPLPHAVGADVVAFHHPDHPVSGEYRALRDDLLKQVGAGGPKAVAPGPQHLQDGNPER